MPLVSEGMGLKEANTMSVFLRQLALLLAQALRDEKKKGYTDEHMKGAKAILKHIKKGGQVLYQSVDTEDAALFEKFLQNQRVPYTKIAEVDGKVVFATRDVDKKAVERAFEMLADEIKVGFREMTPQEFLSENAGREVGHAMGYTETELEIFRKEAANIGFSYTVVGNEKQKGRYDILYSTRDEALVKKALKSVAYEVSGPDGKEYTSAIEESLAVKASVLARSKQDRNLVQYIVNANNPMQFITIQGSMMVQHSLTVEEKIGRDGKVKVVVKDKAKKTMPFGNRELTNAMKAYGKCAVVPEEKNDFVQGFDDTKSAIIPDAEKAVRTLEALHTEVKAKKYPIYEANISRKGNAKFDKICTLTDIDQSVLLDITKEMKKAGLYYIAASGDFLYKEQDRQAVEAILDRTLYKDLSPMEKFEDKIYYEGRAPKGVTDEPIYVVSGKDPNIVLKITPENFEIMKDGAVVSSVSASDPNFETQLVSLLEKMEDVAVLTESEMKKEPAEKVALIEERMLPKENQASIQYFRDYQEKKAQFVNTKIEDMSPKDKEIMRAYTEHEIQVTYVEKSFTEKITDMDFGTKMQEREVSTTRTERSTDYER